LYLQSVAFFDIDGDDQKELIAVFRGNPNLAIYELSSGGAEFQRELGLPFRAGLISETSDTWGNSYLHVIANTLNRSATFSGDHPGTFYNGTPPTLRSVKTIQLDSTTRYGTRSTFSVLFYGDRVTIIRIQPTGLSVAGSFLLQPEVPTILISDFHGIGELQTMFIP
jgi:hypothetical protein